MHTSSIPLHLPLVRAVTCSEHFLALSSGLSVSKTAEEIRDDLTSHGSLFWLYVPSLRYIRDIALSTRLLFVGEPHFASLFREENTLWLIAGSFHSWGFMVCAKPGATGSSLHVECGMDRRSPWVITLYACIPGVSQVGHWVKPACSVVWVEGAPWAIAISAWIPGGSQEVIG